VVLPTGPRSEHWGGVRINENNQMINCSIAIVLPQLQVHIRKSYMAKREEQIIKCQTLEGYISKDIYILYPI
jgi:hypothetical protein